MKHVSILAVEDAAIYSIDGSVRLFNQINDILEHKGQGAFYKVEIVGIKSTVSLGKGIYTIACDKILPEPQKTDLIIIPITSSDYKLTVKRNHYCISWILEQYKNGAEVASLCMGAFLLAASGLLDGKSCATHWSAQDEFQRMFPRVKLKPEKIITDECGLYTSGGNYSYLNLLLYLVEKHLGRNFSILASKIFEVDFERKTQSLFTIFKGQKQHGDELVLAAQEYIEENFRFKFTVNYLCTKYSVNRRTLDRRFKKHTGNSILQYIQKVRIEAAKVQLEIGRKSINEILSEVGYMDKSCFREFFKKYTGYSPIDYLKKYAV